MRTFATVLAVAAVAAVASESGTGAGQPARLRILDMSPLTLRGESFRPRERVKIAATVGETTTASSVVANRQGQFRIALPGVDFRRCRGDRELRAIGSRGSRVELKINVTLACPGGGGAPV
jgi:hypothetical protein